MGIQGKDKEFSERPGAEMFLVFYVSYHVSRKNCRRQDLRRELLHMMVK